MSSSENPGQDERSGHNISHSEPPSSSEPQGSTFRPEDIYLGLRLPEYRLRTRDRPDSESHMTTAPSGGSLSSTTGTASAAASSSQASDTTPWSPQALPSHFERLRVRAPTSTLPMSENTSSASLTSGPSSTTGIASAAAASPNQPSNTARPTLRPPDAFPFSSHVERLRAEVQFESTSSSTSPLSRPSTNGIASAAASPNQPSNTTRPTLRPPVAFPFSFQLERLRAEVQSPTYPLLESTSSSTSPVPRPWTTGIASAAASPTQPGDSTWPGRPDLSPYPYNRRFGSFYDDPFDPRTPASTLPTSARTSGSTSPASGPSTPFMPPTRLVPYTGGLHYLPYSPSTSNIATAFPISQCEECGSVIPCVAHRALGITSYTLNRDLAPNPASTGLAAPPPYPHPKCEACGATFPRHARMQRAGSPWPGLSMLGSSDDCARCRRMGLECDAYRQGRCTRCATEGLECYKEGERPW